MARTHSKAPADVNRVAAELNVTLGRLVRRLRQAHSPGDLTLSEASVLARLDREAPATPTELALGEKVKPQAMATTLATLESQGLVLRTADPADGRRALITMTPAGKAALGQRRSAKTAGMALALAQFTDAERDQLSGAIALLDRLADLL